MFLEAEHLWVRDLHGMDGWVYKKNNITTVMEILKERFVLCHVVSCHVSCVCVLQGPDAKPRDHRAPLSQDFLA